MPDNHVLRSIGDMPAAWIAQRLAGLCLCVHSLPSLSRAAPTHSSAVGQLTDARPLRILRDSYVRRVPGVLSTTTHAVAVTRTKSTTPVRNTSPAAVASAQIACEHVLVLVRMQVNGLNYDGCACSQRVRSVLRMATLATMAAMSCSPARNHDCHCPGAAQSAARNPSSSLGLCYRSPVSGSGI